MTQDPTKSPAVSEREAIARIILPIVMRGFRERMSANDVTDEILARLAPAPEIVVTQDQRERALAAGRAIVHGQGDGSYQEATNAIHLLLAALGGSQPVPEQGVQGSKAWVSSVNDAANKAVRLGNEIAASIAQPEAARVGEDVCVCFGDTAFQASTFRRRDGIECCDLCSKPCREQTPEALVTPASQNADAALRATTLHLVAAISLLRKYHEACAPTKRHALFGTMIADYEKAAETGRAALAPAPRNANETGQDEALRETLESALRALDQRDSTPIIRRLARIQIKHAIAALATQPKS